MYWFFPKHLGHSMSMIRSVLAHSACGICLLAIAPQFVRGRKHNVEEVTTVWSAWSGNIVIYRQTDRRCIRRPHVWCFLWVCCGRCDSAYIDWCQCESAHSLRINGTVRASSKVSAHTQTYIQTVCIILVRSSCWCKDLRWPGMRHFNSSTEIPV